MPKLHQRRVEDQVRRVLSELIQRRLRDPRLGMVSVARVDLTSDLRHGTAYLSVVGDEEAAGASLEVVRRAAGFLRSELGQSMRLRHVPDIEYAIDESTRAQIRIEEILREAEPPSAREADPREADPGEGEGGR